MDAQDIRNLQEAYMEVCSESYVDLFKSPPAGGKTMQGNKSKGETIGNPARLSPAMRALQRSDQLKATEPGSRRQQLQTKRSNSINRSFQSARRVSGRSSSGTGLADHYDLYDIILSHLLDEGYAETPEAAEAIMVNMSEEWRRSIIG
jgi:hypothetical protein